MSSIYKSKAGEQQVKQRYRQFLDEWPVPNDQISVPTREGETFVVACGPPSAPPVILLHGSAFNSASWMADVAEWAGRFRLYAVDVIGHPGLSAPFRPTYDSDAHALWLDDVLDGLGLEKAAMVGISLGGLAGYRLCDTATLAGDGSGPDVSGWSGAGTDLDG